MTPLSTNITHSIFAITTILMLSGCEDTNQNTNQLDTKNEASQSILVMMKSRSDSTTSGQVTFKENNGEVNMKAFFSGLEPGKHAIHIHANADCSAPDGKSAGGHWNPTDEKHGQWGNEDGYHKGDIGNFDVDDDGKGHISMQTNEWCIGCKNDSKNILNKSVIVHKGTDDFVSQPSGDAGTRVACGEITR